MSPATVKWFFVTKIQIDIFAVEVTLNDIILSDHSTTVWSSKNLIQRCVPNSD